jgi:hypothetical protein
MGYGLQWMQEMVYFHVIAQVLLCTFTCHSTFGTTVQTVIAQQLGGMVHKSMGSIAQWCGVLTCHSTFCTTVWTVIAQ